MKTKLKELLIYDVLLEACVNNCDILLGVKH